jgi:DNA repair protein RadC
VRHPELGRSPPTASPDAGHRRFLALGGESVSDVELVAMSARIGPEAARSLLASYGTLVSLAAADLTELVREHGLSRRAAVSVAAAFELGRRLAAARAEPGWRVRAPSDVADRLLPAMRQLEREELRVLLLNTKNVVTAAATVYAGNLAGSSVRVGEVFRLAVRRQAAAVVVVHNHPSGDPTPSADDVRITAELAEAGRLLDIELLDHLVVGADGWVSLRALGAAGSGRVERIVAHPAVADEEQRIRSPG